MSSSSLILVPLVCASMLFNDRKYSFSPSSPETSHLALVHCATKVISSVTGVLKSYVVPFNVQLLNTYSSRKGFDGRVALPLIATCCESTVSSPPFMSKVTVYVISSHLAVSTRSDDTVVFSKSYGSDAPSAYHPVNVLPVRTGSVGLILSSEICSPVN